MQILNNYYKLKIGELQLITYEYNKFRVDTSSSYGTFTTVSNVSIGEWITVKCSVTTTNTVFTVIKDDTVIYTKTLAGDYTSNTPCLGTGFDNKDPQGTVKTLNFKDLRVIKA